MPKKAGPWTITATKVAYQTPWITVHEDAVVSRAGTKRKYAWVEMPEGVNVLPVDEKGNVYLAEEYRHAIRRTALEGMSGGIEKGASPLSTAKRELKEEMGMTAKKWTRLGTFESVTSKIRHREHLYLAEGLTFGKQELEEGEEIRIVKMPFTRALAHIRSGKITYGFTALALLLATKARKKGKKK